MKPVFADTGFFLALVNARDQYHQTATSLNASLVTPLLTTAWVLLEFANAIATSRARSEFGSTLARLRSERDAEIIAPSPELFDRDCELYTSRSDKEWSLTDCISFVVMKDPIAIRSFRSQTVMLQPQDIARLIEEFFRLAAGNSRRYGCQGHEFAFGDRSR
jgi:predicted nucleic acid-binding protein